MRWKNETLKYFFADELKFVAALPAAQGYSTGGHFLHVGDFTLAACYFINNNYFFVFKTWMTNI